MSCPNYHPANPRRVCQDAQYPYGHYSSASCTSTVRSNYSDTCGSGSCPGWMTPDHSVSSLSGTETSREGRGDPPFPDMNMQIGRTRAARAADAGSQQRSSTCSTVSTERTRARLKMLEDHNVVLQTRTQNLITENKALRSRLEEQTRRTESLEMRISSLREELGQERAELSKRSNDQDGERSHGRENKDSDVAVKERATSTTDVTVTVDRGVQEWAVCKGCQRKLESCEKEPPTVTITRAELEVLEKDMQVLRDAVIAREEAWDTAMEREQTYRQQLARLTAETITERHISNSRLEELQTLSDALMEKETEVKSQQKEMVYLNKLIVKLSKRQRDSKDCSGDASVSDLTEKDQKAIDEIVRRVSCLKSKQKVKYRSGGFEKSAEPSVQQSSTCDGRSPRSSGKDQREIL